jgi:hypothetical protein
MIYETWGEISQFFPFFSLLPLKVEFLRSRRLCFCHRRYDWRAIEDGIRCMLLLRVTHVHVPAMSKIKDGAKNSNQDQPLVVVPGSTRESCLVVRSTHPCCRSKKRNSPISTNLICTKRCKIERTVLVIGRNQTL